MRILTSLISIILLSIVGVALFLTGLKPKECVNLVGSFHVEENAEGTNDLILDSDGTFISNINELEGRGEWNCNGSDGSYLGDLLFSDGTVLFFFHNDTNEIYLSGYTENGRTTKLDKELRLNN